MSEAERELFDELEGDAQREAFVEAFWGARGSDSLERWRRHREESTQLRSRSRWRERAVRLAGKPEVIDKYSGCQGLRTLEVWRWEAWQLDPRGEAGDDATTMVFVQTISDDRRSLEPWQPGDFSALSYGSTDASNAASFLSEIEARDCLGSRVVRLERALHRAISEEGLLRSASWPRPDSLWLEQLRDDLASGDPSPASKATIDISFPGAFNEFSIVQGRVELPPERLHQLVEGQLFDRVTLTGDIYRGRRLADSFRIVHHVAGAAPADAVRLDFFRRLRPATYDLRLRVADRNGIALLHRRIELTVPPRDAPAPDPAGYSAGYSLLTRAESIVLNTLPSIEILPPATRGGADRLIRAVTTGGPISKVEVSVDGESVLDRAEPPYETTVPTSDLRRKIEALALDPQGRPLAHDERWLEPSDRPTFLRFAEPSGNGEVEIRVSRPVGEEPGEVHCTHSGQRVAVLSAPPYLCPLPDRPYGRLDYVTASTALDNGELLEDVLFLGEILPEELEVRLAELYLKVQDARGRPVLGLGEADFRVWEAGEERPLERAESLDNLPLSVAVLMDVSSSMGRRVNIASESAQGFFRQLLTEGDQASLLAFNQDLHLLVPFTSDQRRLRRGAQGIRAWGSTRLYDAIVFALFQFTGREHRRALVILSDGADVESAYPFEQVLSAAESSTVAVYPISIGPSDERTRTDLGRLAEHTGGQWFGVDSVSELDSVFERIERELRSQYLLVFHPRSEGIGSVQLDPVEVEVMRTGLTARNVRGHYP